MAGGWAEPLRTGAGYESVRRAALSALAAAAEHRRVDLGADLALVFLSSDSVRAAAEETLRAERVVDATSIAEEADGFASLRGGDGVLSALLIVDLSDPLALSERLADLAGVGEAVSLDVDGSRFAAQAEPDDGSGAWLLRFSVDVALDSAAVAVVVEHRALKANVGLTGEQVRAVAADMRG